MVFFNDFLTQVLLSHLLRFMLLANPTPVFLFSFYLFIFSFASNSIHVPCVDQDHHHVFSLIY